MEKKILVAVDDSTHSKKAVEYAASMRSIIPELNFILFNVQPTISDYLTHDSNIDSNARTALKEVVSKNDYRFICLSGPTKISSIHIIANTPAFNPQVAYHPILIPVFSAPAILFRFPRPRPGFRIQLPEQSFFRN